MKLTRREFIRYALIASGGVVTAAVTARLGLQPTSADLLPLQEVPPGELDEATLTTLTAFAETYVNGHGSAAHYRAFFAWRAKNLPTYRGVYLAFSAALDATMQALVALPFAQADESTRRDLLTYVLALPDPTTPLLDPMPNDLPPASLLPEDEPLPVVDALWLAFDRLVFAEIVFVFLQTNAYLLLGYRSYPGQARGLIEYTQPIIPQEDA